MMQLLDLEEIRHANPLPAVVGGMVKLHRSGNEWKACCPLHNERTPSFTIFAGGRRYHCFGCGAHGDVLDLIQHLHGVSLRDAAAMLTGGDLPRIDVAPIPARDDTINRMAEARAVWDYAVPAAGTLAEAYLRWRGIDIDPPMSIRFAELPYGKHGEILPCLVACVSSREGPLQGVQRIFLARDGRGKADVPAPKLSLGRIRGGAVRLAGLDDGELIVTEGPETGLSLLQTLQRPVWVACGGSMLPAMEFPPSVRAVAIGGDNDDAGRAKAKEAAEVFSSRGIRTRLFYPPAPFGDFNDLLISGERA